MPTAYMALVPDGVEPPLSDLKWSQQGFLLVSHNTFRQAQVEQTLKLFHDRIVLTADTTSVPRLAENLAGLFRREELPHVDRSWRHIELQPGDTLLLLIPTEKFKGEVAKSSSRPID